MQLPEYARYDGLGLAELVRKKEISAKELARLALAGVRALNPALNAAIETYDDRIETMDPQNLRFEAPFCGVPFFLKDIGATEAGKFQEMGSRLAKGYIADRDSYLTQRFKQAGVNILGRTTTPEFGLTFTTESILTGATSNPWNPDLTAGGSSGGAAAAVAAGILPVAHANDAGGSIRVPAACCGLVGLKPSRGRVTAGPDSGEAVFGIVQELVVSRTVRDTAAMLDAVSGPADGDPFVIVQPSRPYITEMSTPVDQLKIAFTTECWTGDRVAPEIAAAVRRIARVCEEMGHGVEESRPHFDIESFVRLQEAFWDASLVVGCDLLAQQMGRSIDADTLEHVTLDQYQRAKNVSLMDLCDAFARLNQICRQVGQFFATYDLLVTPTTAQLPVPLGTTHLNQQISIQEYENTAFTWVPFTNLFNFTGQPAISLPLVHSKTNLPIGIQFVGRFGAEDVLLKVAHAFEKALPWIGHRPPIHVSTPHN